MTEQEKDHMPIHSKNLDRNKTANSKSRSRLIIKSKYNDGS